jgi:hypothetical protein
MSDVMTKTDDVKETQGHDKMLRYIEDLVRNKEFRKQIKRLRSLGKYSATPDGYYKDWSPEEQKRHDWINDELGSIINGYESLRKRTNRIIKTKDNLVKENIALNYGLDNNLISLASYKIKNNNSNSSNEVDFRYYDESPDMCRVIDIYDDELNPENPGEEIIYMRHDRQLLFCANPVAIAINQRASKRDVLDYVEKKWSNIEMTLRNFDDKKPLRLRKRKHPQEMVDLIWENQSLPPKQILEKLDNKFPNNVFVYYEITKIIQLERKRRHGTIT